MYYHSPQFQNIADQAAAYARPLILQTIQELATDFTAKFPQYTRFDCSTGSPIDTFTGYPQIKVWEHPFVLFLYDVLQKDLIGFCPDITLQPAILVDGVPIDEAICNAQPVIYSVEVSDGAHYNGNHFTKTVYAGPGMAQAFWAIDNWQPPHDENPAAYLHTWKDGKIVKTEERRF